jgi:hypothetical protein
VSKEERLGDAPIEDEYAATMNRIALLLDVAFNGKNYDDARSTGFVLLVFPFGSKTGRCNYISNGADREDIVRLFKEQIKRFEGLKDG